MYKTINPDNLPLVDYRELNPIQENLKDLSEKNYKKLLNSIKKYGFKFPVFIWQDSEGKKHLLDGTQRCRVLVKENIKFENTGYQIPALTVDAENARDAVAQLLHITSGYGKSTQEGYDELVAKYEISEVEVEDVEIRDLFAEYDGKDDEDDSEVEEDEAPALAEEVFSELGKVYQLGEHRVMCGSATDEEDANQLFGEVTADLYLTDPPYNVDYTGKTKDALKIENDKMDDSEFRAFLGDSYRRADEHMKQGASFYIFHADSEGYNFRGACFDVEWLLKQCLIWKKQSMVMGRQDYHWQHEPILYGWKSGAAHSWHTDRKQTTILEFDRPSRNAEHPTMKPLNIIAYLISNSSKAGDVVLDNFLGSGSTLIACEQTNRKCYGMELDPKYVDVVRKRYAKFISSDDKVPDSWQELTPEIEVASE